MAKVEDCPGFETFGADVKAARKAKHLTRKVLAEIVGIEWRYGDIQNHNHRKDTNIGKRTFQQQHKILFD